MSLVSRSLSRADDGLSPLACFGGNLHVIILPGILPRCSRVRVSYPAFTFIGLLRNVASHHHMCIHAKISREQANAACGSKGGLVASISLSSSGDQTKHQRGMYHIQRKATISNSRKVIIYAPSLSNVPAILRGVGLLRVLKLLLARIELDELVRDRPLDKDLVDIACQLRGEVDLEQSVGQ